MPVPQESDMRLGTFGSKMTRRAALGAGLMLGLVMGLAGQVSAQSVITVDGPDELAQALRKAKGAVLELAPGRYPTVTLRGENAPRVLRSQDPTRPAEINRLTVRDVSELTLDGLLLRYYFTEGDPIFVRPFQILNSRQIELFNTAIQGDLARGIDDVTDGFGYGTGLSVKDTNTVTIAGNRFTDWYRGMVVAQSQNVVVRGNEVTELRMDGMNFAEVKNVLIERNYIHNFNRSLGSKDHADMIQFWTARTATPTENVLIRNNVLNSGKGAYTQSIYMRNEIVDTGKAGAEMYYRNLRIEENVVLNAHAHGITVGETTGLMVVRNTLLQNPESKGSTPPSRMLWVPQVRIKAEARNVIVDGNMAGRFEGPAGQPDWQVRNNQVIQRDARMDAGFYGRFFDRRWETQPTDVGAYRYLSTVKEGLGAAMLRAPQ